VNLVTTTTENSQIEANPVSGWVGGYRVYNNDDNQPYPWCIDSGVGSQKFWVGEVYIYTNAFGNFKTGHGWPEQWLEGFGHVAIADDVAVIEDAAVPTKATSRDLPL
jgi:hypothetical protein